MRIDDSQPDKHSCVRMKQGFDLWIAKIENKIPEMYLIASERSGKYDYVEGQTRESGLEIVRKDRAEMGFFMNRICDIILLVQTGCLILANHLQYKLDLEDVRKDCIVLRFMDYQTEEMCLIAVKQDGMILEYVHKQTDRICWVAINQNGLALRYVKDQTEDMCIAAVMKVGSTLQYVHNQTEEMCLIAVKAFGGNLKYVENQTYDICYEANERSKGASKWIRDKDMRKQIEIGKRFLMTKSAKK